MASTHTEVYRPYTGTLRPEKLRFLPLARASIRTALKRKLPLVILYAPIVIGTVIYSFVCYARFAIKSGSTPDALGGGANPGAMLVAGMAESMLQVRKIIVPFYLGVSIFTLLIFSWYGAGLIAEDRRAGAHLLYFARPLTRLDYVLGKLATLAFFGALAVLVPPLVICTVAAISSPEWSFLKHEGMVVPQTIVFGLLWIVSWSSIELAISSVTPRKSFALVASFGFFLLPHAIATLLAELEKEPRFHLLSLQSSFMRIAASLFDTPSMGLRFEPGLAYATVAGYTLLAWAVLAWRVRRMEVVA
jgi:ABC-2 type transport system permease protein